MMAIHPSGHLSSGCTLLSTHRCWGPGRAAVCLPIISLGRGGAIQACEDSGHMSSKPAATPRGTTFPCLGKAFFSLQRGIKTVPASCELTHLWFSFPQPPLLCVGLGGGVRPASPTAELGPAWSPYHTLTFQGNLPGMWCAIFQWLRKKKSDVLFHIMFCTFFVQ